MVESEGSVCPCSHLHTFLRVCDGSSADPTAPCDEVLATWTNIAALPLAHLLDVLDAESVGNVFEFQAQLFAALVVSGVLSGLERAG